MSTETDTKNYERGEIQRPLQEALEKQIAELHLAPNAAHARRLVRAVLRIAASTGLENGCMKDAFLEMAKEAFGKEACGGDKLEKPAPSAVTISFVGEPVRRFDKRPLGGSVVFLARDIKTNVPIFGDVQEIGAPGGAIRIVRPGSDLECSILALIAAERVGTAPLRVTTVRSADEFTIEYKTGYGRPA